LVKRYPSSVKKAILGRPGRRATSLRGIFEVLMRRGSFITALDGVTLKVKKGEIFGLLGPNGAGKTTFIKILCTLILHDEGEAYVNGFDVRREPQQVLRNLQAVIGGAGRGFDWRLTARQGLEFYASLYGLSKQEAQEKIDFLLEFTGLRDRANDMYQRYSGGMRRKLVLCRALLLDVPIVLFDEPTIGLDPPSAAEIRELLHDKLSRDEGKTVLITTHNMWEAQEICDRIAILYRGKIIACDSPDNIRRLIRPETIYNVTFQNPKFSKRHEKMLKDLKGVAGVKNLVPEVTTEGIFQKLTLYLDKNHSLSSVLKVLLAHGLEIKSIDAREPALEEAFIALTQKEPKK
jgi:ABC-2 type transport system ATP-binding protein